MEPRIQYAKTEDGVSIAFSTLGETGLSCVSDMPHSYVKLEQQIAERGRCHESLAGGGGLS